MDATPSRRPVDPHHTPSTAPTASAEPSVLVVDDSRFVRASLVRGLAGRFPLRQAESGERAWELLLLDASIGAVLSDLSMPGMDGFELLAKVRGSLLDRVRLLPFAVLSGADDPALRERARGLGADRFAVKGEAVDDLASWIAARLRVVAPPEAATPSLPDPVDTPDTGPMPRLVPDPLARWFQAAVGRAAAAGDAAPALLRLHAPAIDDLPARLRRGVRGADALHVDGTDTAWLCVPATGPLALRLAMRFGLLAAGRQATASGPAAAGVSLSLHPVDPQNPGGALAVLQAAPPDDPVAGRLAIRAFASAWGPAWHCALPWPAARMLIG